MGRVAKDSIVSKHITNANVSSSSLKRPAITKERIWLGIAASMTTASLVSPVKPKKAP